MSGYVYDLNDARDGKILKLFRVERVRGNIATIVRIKKVAFVKVGLQNCCNLTT